ncbi:MAG: hypothetical protein WD689_01050 [Gaiellaceae bacterium]
MSLLNKLRGTEAKPEPGSERQQIETSIIVLAYQPRLWQEIRSSPRYELSTTLDRSMSGQLAVIARMGNLFRYFNGEVEIDDEDLRWTAIGIRDLVAIHESGRDLKGHLQSIVATVVGPEKAMAQLVLRLVDPADESSLTVDVPQARERLARVQ